MKQFNNTENKFHASSRLLFAKFNGPTIVSKPEIKKINQLSSLLYYTVDNQDSVINLGTFILGLSLIVIYFKRITLLVKVFF